jgi:hypothetical protein
LRARALLKTFVIAFTMLWVKIKFARRRDNFRFRVWRKEKQFSRKGAGGAKKDAKKAFKLKSPSTLCELSLRLCAFARNFFSAHG